MTEIEIIALDKLKEEIVEIANRIKENEATPAREVQYVLPFMNRNVKEALRIIGAIKDSQKKAAH